MSKDFGPGLAGTHRRYRTLLFVFGAIFVIGLGWFIWASPGMTATDWGVFTATWMFLTGISQFGIVFSATMRISEAEWARPYHRLAELATFAWAPFAFLGFLAIYFGGRHDMLFWLSAGEDVHLSPWLSDFWLLWRNLLGMALFYAVAGWYAAWSLMPDVEEEMLDKVPGWYRFKYRVLLAMKKRRDPERLKAALWRYAAIVPVVFVLNQTFIAWDFGMMLWPHYHSTVYPMYYVLGNIFGGTSMVFLLGGLVSGMGNLGSYFDVERRAFMGTMVTGFTLLYMYFFWAQFFVTWYGNLPNEMAPIWAKMFGHYKPLFWTMMACVFFIPLGTLIFAPVKRMYWSLASLAVIMLFGVWLNRYLMVLPRIAEDHQAFSAATEVMTSLGMLAGFVLMLLAMYQLFPVMSRWELELKEYRPDLEDHPRLW